MVTFSRTQCTCMHTCMYVCFGKQGPTRTVCPSIRFWNLDNLRKHAKKLNRFHMTCLRKLLHITWRDKIPDTEVMRRTELPTMYTLLTKAQLCYTGHVVCMNDERLPKRLQFGELCNENESQLSYITELIYGSVANIKFSAHCKWHFWTKTKNKTKIKIHFRPKKLKPKMTK